MNEILKRLTEKVNEGLKVVEVLGEKFTVSRPNATESLSLSSTAKQYARLNTSSELKKIKAEQSDLVEFESMYGKQEDWTTIIGKKKPSTIYDIELAKCYIITLISFRSVDALRDSNGSKVYNNVEELKAFANIISGQTGLAGKIVNIQNGYSSEDSGNETGA